MKRIRTHLGLAGAILILVVSVAGAQTGSTPEAPSTTLPSVGGTPPTPSPRPPLQQHIEGPVKAVDVLEKTVSVGWMFGLLSTTLEVTGDTRIAVEGTTGSLVDIREGDLVKAAYADHDGKNVATAIEVTEAEARRGAEAPPAAGTPSTSDRTTTP
ncbi:MAG: hypothetical protein EHM71_00225 [Zetaproteobacteria bacterium]|nr:MAG: hypothetical protein EHM71_00225 [Zetaproteobacteria bacterium]